MRNGYFFNPLKGLRAGCNVVDGVGDLGAIVANAAGITDADDDSFENDKTLLVLEGFTSNFLRPNSALAVFAPIAVRILFSELRGFHKQ